MRGFTIVELVIVIAILAIISAVLIPQMTSAFDSGKDKIIDIYNGGQVKVIDVDTGEIIYEGDRDRMDIDGYTLVDVAYGDSIIMYVRLKERG